MEEIEGTEMMRKQWTGRSFAQTNGIGILYDGFHMIKSFSDKTPSVE